MGARTDQLRHAAPGSTTFHGIHWQGRTRTFLLHLPPRIRAGERVPLVVLLHGSGGNANIMMDESHMNAHADSAGVAVAYPNGTGWMRYFFLTWSSGNCCGDARAYRSDDVGFLRALVARLEAQLPIDSTRVYMAGFSDGARMAYRMACVAAPMLAGVGAVAGAPADTTCTPSLPVSVEIIHGTADESMPYAAPGRRRRGEPPATVPQTFAWWAQRDGCEGAPRHVMRDSVVTETFDRCRGGVAVELRTIVGGVHGWPGGDRAIFTEPRPSRALDASGELLRFFAGFRRLPGGTYFTE